jgi:hypothetical protein
MRVMKPGRISPTFRRNELPPFSGLKSKPRKIYIAIPLLAVTYLLGSLFNPEDGHSTFLRNVAELQPEYTAPHSRRQ